MQENWPKLRAQTPTPDQQSSVKTADVRISLWINLAYNKAHTLQIMFSLIVQTIVAQTSTGWEG